MSDKHPVAAAFDAPSYRLVIPIAEAGTIFNRIVSRFALFVEHGPDGMRLINLKVVATQTRRASKMDAVTSHRLVEAMARRRALYAADVAFDVRPA